ncbi:DUF2147 domain-containing protein [Paracoccus sulfuroxidans]|uniref:Uncharacterized protein (DUF2147 family) n=1 Tax=Paracoccus sulfuroxidans TaxID=384678 RepID=A0A562NBH6_9RHOB|nr:DUF2147 domain-containing protein [Paracoccus sulfuroxidans]TWI29453.1 uncharacterized protein (DUF2147 family) [Paracoccus sulfuroxidans]
MKTIAFATLALLAGTMAHADGISGIFQTQANDEGNIGMVQFYDCGGKFCGKLVKSFDAAGNEISSPHTGKNIVANMSDDGGGKFSGGTIWDPGADKTYRSKMELKGANLAVSGCVAIICRTQNWIKVQ